MVEFLHIVVGHTQLALVAAQALFERKTHNALLTVGGGQHGYTDIVLSAVHEIGHSAVLGLSLFGNIHARQDLDSGKHRACQLVGIFMLGVHHTVNTEAHAQGILQRLDMDIRGSLSCRLLQQRIDQHDDGRRADILVSLLLHCTLCVLSLLRKLGNRGTQRFGTKAFIDGVHDLGSGCHYGLHAQVREQLHILNRTCVHGIEHCQLHQRRLVIGHSDRHDAVLFEHADIQSADQLLVKRLALQLHQGQSVFERNRCSNISFQRIFALQNHLLLALAGSARLHERKDLTCILARHLVSVYQYLADSLFRRHWTSPSPVFAD